MTIVSRLQTQSPENPQVSQSGFFEDGKYSQTLLLITTSFILHSTEL